MKKIIFPLLFLITTLILNSCSSESEASVLYGKWQTEIAISEEVTADILSFFDFTSEEIELIDKTGLATVKTVSFGNDGSYEFCYDTEATKALFSEYFDRCIRTVHDNLGSLSAVFGGVEYGFDEFADYYADVYGFDSYEEYREKAASAFVSDYFDLGDGTIERGSCKVSGGSIIMTEEGEVEPRTLGYTVTDGGELILTYTNTTETYRR